MEGGQPSPPRIRPLVPIVSAVHRALLRHESTPGRQQSHAQTRRDRSVTKEGPSECISYPIWHKFKTTESRTGTKGTLTTEHNGYKTKRLITGGNQGEVNSTGQVRKEGGKLGLGEDAIRTRLRQPCQFLHGKTTIKINDRADTDKLNSWFLLQPIRLVGLMKDLPEGERCGWKAWYPRSNQRPSPSTNDRRKRKNPS